MGHRSERRCDDFCSVTISGDEAAPQVGGREGGEGKNGWQGLGLGVGFGFGRLLILRKGCDSLDGKKAGWAGGG